MARSSTAAAKCTTKGESIRKSLRISSLEANVARTCNAAAGGGRRAAGSGNARRGNGHGSKLVTHA